MCSVKKDHFEYRREEGQNPYIGFMSFQHFRGEKMYSDIVVKPENRFTETERVECYPVSPDAEENGREEGWYPDTTVAYIRILWKEFEPSRGEYNYRFIQSIIDQAKAHKQTLILRLMPHSTRACDDLPDWLKALIPCPSRPPMQRAKDSPTHPLFMELFLEAVKKLGDRFDADPWLDAVDISLPGAWGEGTKLELYPDNLFFTIADTYTKAFPNTQLFTQLSRPQIIDYAKKDAAVGWRGDGLGSPYHTVEYYPQMIKELQDNWRVAPVSFEAYWWMCEWERQGWELDPIIESTLGWHISSFNPKSMPIPYEWREKCEDWISRMGYHFTPVSLMYPESTKAGETISLELTIENRGSAPCYKPLPVILRISGNGEHFDFVQDTDIREWVPGTHKVTLRAALPESLPEGRYDLELAILSPHADVVYLATNAERRGNGYKLGSFSVNNE